MSVLIKGVEMPENGSCIQIVIDDDGKVYPSVEKCILKMGSIAKAVPVPPHGRLIDADALKKVVASAKHMDADIYDGRLFYSDHLCVGADYDDVCKAIDETPTIIPASKESE